MTTKVKQALTTGLKLALASGLILWLVHQGAIDFSMLRRLSSPVSLLIGLGLVFAMLFINNYRWLILLRAQGIQTTIRRTLPLSLIGLFFNFAMPGGVGGDVVKGYYLIQDHREQRMAGVVSILMDRVVGFFMMIFTSALALIFSWGLVAHNGQMNALASGVFALFLAFAAFYVVALSRRIGRSRLMRFVFERVPGGRVFKRVYDVLHSYRRSPGALTLAFALSVTSQLMLIILVYLVAIAMGETTIPFLAYCFLVPVGIVATALPVSPAGVGVGQAAFFFLFNLYLGRESQVGPTAVTAMQLLQFLWGIPGAIFYLRRGKPKMNENAVEQTA